MFLPRISTRQRGMCGHLSRRIYLPNCPEFQPLFPVRPHVNTLAAAFALDAPCPFVMAAAASVGWMVAEPVYWFRA